MRQFFQLYIRQKTMASVLIPLLWVLTSAQPAPAQPPARVVAKTREQVREWNAKDVQVRIDVATGSTLKGRIVGVDAETFLLRQEAGPDVTVPYADVKRIQKQGRGAKVILIPALIGGAVVVVLCVAPYPIGFLCRHDPS